MLQPVQLSELSETMYSYTESLVKFVVKFDDFLWVQESFYVLKKCMPRNYQACRNM